MGIEKIEEGKFQATPVDNDELATSQSARAARNFPYYSQRDKDWGKLCTIESDFENYGCGICCAAMITEYKEGVTTNPETMLKRGVWTKSDLTTQWSNASKKFTFQGAELVDNPTGIYKEIKNQIDKYGDPVVLRLYNKSGSFKHFVVAYDYTGSCTGPADVLIKDPYNNYKTLKAAEATWPVLKYLMRII